METLTNFLLAVLVVYRVAYLIAEDEGPFSSMAKLRGRVDPTRATWLGRGIRCPMCVSFWLAFFAAFFLPGLFLENWLALAGAVLLLIRSGR